MAAKKARDSAVDHELPSDEGGPERRQWQRVLVDIEVDYGNEDNYLFAYIRDISATGIFVRTNSPEQPGTRLNLRFTPNGQRSPFELEGEVIWWNPYRPGSKDNLHPGMGIRFIGLTEDDRRRLSGLIKTFAYLSDDGDGAADRRRADDDGGGQN
ncbi:MAG TPA: TIGR02266 family protein [Kofleriaceae bacterium]|nr:TIGR02266 family protein [Kofleriaceae bacterium]